MTFNLVQYRNEAARQDKQYIHPFFQRIYIERSKDERQIQSNSCSHVLPLDLILLSQKFYEAKDQLANGIFQI
jgi:hypothetical protein